MANKYGLDLHCEMILEEYHDYRDSLETMKGIVLEEIDKALKENNLFITGFEARIKTESSLAGKLQLKGSKYLSLDDITDILGARIITFYTDDVDKIAAIITRLFDIDWDNSVDKRKMHQLDSFGYNSLHFICRIPKSIYSDPLHPEINSLRFELQMRTALQHVWATINHDTGYKTGVDIPPQHLRTLNRLAGVLELVDDEFSRLRTSITDYRRQVKELVSSGKFDDVQLDGDSFWNYLKLKPFDGLNKRIAAINQAEIQEASAMPYLALLKNFGFNTLGDVDRFIKSNSEDAYQFAILQLGATDIDIIISTVAIQDLCIVHIIKNGRGKEGLIQMFEAINGVSAYNESRAERILEQVQKLKFN